MKHLKQFALLLLTSPVWAQTTGAPLNLNVPIAHSQNWNVPMNNNSMIINNAYGLLAPKESPTFTGTATFNNIVINGTCTGSGCGGGGGGAVASVFGRIGIVAAATNDYTFNQIGGSLNLATQGTGQYPSNS